MMNNIFNTWTHHIRSWNINWHSLRLRKPFILWCIHVVVFTLFQLYIICHYSIMVFFLLYFRIIVKCPSVAVSITYLLIECTIIHLIILFSFKKTWWPRDRKRKNDSIDNVYFICMRIVGISVLNNAALIDHFSLIS